MLLGNYTEFLVPSYQTSFSILIHYVLSKFPSPAQLGIKKESAFQIVRGNKINWTIMAEKVVTGKN